MREGTQQRAVVLLFLFVCGALVDAAGYWSIPPSGARMWLRAGLSALFIILTMLAGRRRRFERYGPVLWAFGAISLCLLAAGTLSRWFLPPVRLAPEEAAVVVVAKRVEALPLVLAMLLVTALSRRLGLCLPTARATGSIAALGRADWRARVYALCCYGRAAGSDARGHARWPTYSTG